MSRREAGSEDRVTRRPKRRRWRFHLAARDELLNDIPQAGQEALTDLMARHRRQEQLLPREIENYGEGLWALKATVVGNEFRCYFFHDGEESQILVGVEFVVKKRQKASLELARRRMKEWKVEGDVQRRDRG